VANREGKRPENRQDDIIKTNLKEVIGITGFLGFVLRTVIEKKTMFRRLNGFPSSDEGGDTYSVGSLRKS
jgi:hypothetical protein